MSYIENIENSLLFLSKYGILYKIILDRDYYN